MPRRLSSLFFLIPLVAGCSAPGNTSAGKLIAVYTPNESTQLVQAPQAATYALYQRSAADDFSWIGQEQIRAQVQIASGKPIGFEKASTGDLLAVAGENRIPLSEGDYLWRLPKAPKSIVTKLDETVDAKLDAMGNPAPQLVNAAYITGMASLYLLCLLGK